MKKSIVRIEWPAFVLVGICSVANQSWAATINVSSCSQSAVQTAINSASNGDTVTVPAGSCSWAGAVTITNKTITLQGAGSGTNGTVINYSGGSHTLLSIKAGSQTGRMDVSGFRFVGCDTSYQSHNYWDAMHITFEGPDGWRNLRVHHSLFTHTCTMRPDIAGDSGTEGLIDHNTFEGSGSAIILSGRGAADWSTPVNFGSAGFFFYRRQYISV